MNFLVSGSPVSHLLTYLTGAGAVNYVNDCRKKEEMSRWIKLAIWYHSSRL